MPRAAAAAYDAALRLRPRGSARGSRYVDYGSDLRDSAAVLAFAAANPGNRTTADRGHRTASPSASLGPREPARRNRPGC